MKKKRYFSIVLKTATVLFALIGLVFSAVFVGMSFGLFNVRGSITERNNFFTTPSNTSRATTTTSVTPCVSATTTFCAWDSTPEWAVILGGLTKDKDIITRVAKETGVSARMIATVVAPEQLRFFTSEREVFKRYFEPLKILGSLSQFSLGVSGIKEATAQDIERYAHSTTSPFYPGEKIDTLFAYLPTDDHDAVLFNRLTDEKNHYFSYLYTALYIKEIEAQWRRSGIDITNRPDIIGTLFNIGFAQSHPNNDAKVGGAPITTGGNTYTFGELGALFFASDELLDIFPR